jgi:hypothetical protein
MLVLFYFTQSVILYHHLIYMCECKREVIRCYKYLLQNLTAEVELGFVVWEDGTKMRS